MTTQSTALPDSPLDSKPLAQPATSVRRPMLWSIRRELWENRSIYIAPVVVAAVVLIGSLIAGMRLQDKLKAMMAMDPVERHGVSMPLSFVAALLIATAFIVGVFYCLDALQGERRDRSILFWKSLPVSDLTAVLSKLSIPLLVLPAVIFVVIVVTQLALLALGGAFLAANGMSASTLWTQFSLPRMSLALAYALIVIALWHAPLYGWLLVVSGWARRASFLWAVMPFVAAAIFEKVAFGTSYVGMLVKHRLVGWYGDAFVPTVGHSGPIDPLQALDPGKFLSSAGLWVGLGFAVALVASAVWLRRHRGPM